MFLSHTRLSQKVTSLMNNLIAYFKSLQFYQETKDRLAKTELSTPVYLVYHR